MEAEILNEEIKKIEEKNEEMKTKRSVEENGLIYKKEKCDAGFGFLSFHLRIEEYCFIASFSIMSAVKVVFDKCQL